MNNRKNILTVAFIFLAACSGPQGDTGAQGPIGPAAATQLESNTQLVVDEVNSLRLAQNQDVINQGLSCTLYTDANPSQITGATLVIVGSFPYHGNFNQVNGNVSDGLSVLPTALISLYKTNLVVKCTGYLINVDNNWHEFDLTSDDGSILTIDGVQVVNNDGLHAAQTKTGAKFLNRGAHSIEVDFLQGQGMEALILNEDNAVLPATTLYH